MDSPSAPPAPDPYATADAQGKANVLAAQQTAALNRPNQITPYGTLKWTQAPGQSSFDQAGFDAANTAYTNAQNQRAVSGDGGDSSALTAPDRNAFTKAGEPGQWTSTIELDPRIQQVLDAQLQQNNQLTGTSSRALQNVDSTISNPLDYGSLPPSGNFWDSRQQAFNRFQGPGQAQGYGNVSQNAEYTNASAATPYRQQSGPQDYSTQAGAQSYQPVSDAQAYQPVGNYNDPTQYIGRGDFSDVKGAIGNQSQIAGQTSALTREQTARLQQLYGTDFNYNNLGAAPSASDATRRTVENAQYERATSRLDPRFSQQENTLRSDLINRGITEGSQAFNDQIANFNRDKNDAYSTAQNDAILSGTRALESQYGLQLQGRQQGVSEANYLRQNPTTEALAANTLNSGNIRDLTSLFGVENAQNNTLLNSQGAQAGQQLARLQAQDQGTFQRQAQENQDVFARDQAGFQRDTQGNQDALAVGNANYQRTAQENADALNFGNANYQRDAQGNADIFARDQANFQRTGATNADRLSRDQLSLQRSNNINANNLAYSQGNIQAGQAQDQSANQYIQSQAAIRAQALQEQEANRARILNEYLGLRSGTQVQNPQFQNGGSGATVGAAPIAQAIQNNYQAQLQQYQTDVGSNNAFLGGLASIGGTAFGGPLGGAAAGALAKGFF